MPGARPPPHMSRRVSKEMTEADKMLGCPGLSTTRTCEGRKDTR